jgi:hypothetical protein
MSGLPGNDDGGSVLALHEVLMAELGALTPLDENDERDLAEYQLLAAEAGVRRQEREAVLAAMNPKPEDKEAICQMAQDAEVRCLNPLVRILHRRKRSALCFSGGGIRSATFSLGVLQGLAKHSLPLNEEQVEHPRLLAEFDFLSTVSGGGYIGSWFSSWVKRSGMDHVLRHLAYRPTRKVDPEAKPVLYLRDYTNYLNPRLGLFSGDTWTLVATTVRNILLNWFVLLPFVAAALLLPVLFTLGLRHPLPMNFNWLLWLGFACGVAGTGSLLHNLPSFGNGRHTEKTITISCLLPLLIAAICFAVWWCWLPDAQARTLPRLDFALFGAAMHFGGVLVAIAASKLAHSQNFAPGKFKPLRLGFACLASVLTGALGAWLVSLVARGMHPQTEESRVYFACFAVPLVLTTLMAVGVFSVGVSSKVTNDDDREWWSRAGALMLISTVAWLVFFCKVLLLPGWVLALSGKWQGALSALSAALGWYVTQAGARSDSRASEGPKSTAESPSLTDKLESWLLPVGALLFLLAVGFTLTMTNRYLADRMHNSGVPFATGVLLVIEVALALLASYAVNVNKFSLHAMYRMRLIRAYLGASNTKRDPNPFTGFDQADNIPLQELSAEKPLHVLNQCLNLVSGKKLAWQQRKAESFTMTRLHAGSFRVGYQSSTTFGYGALPGGLTLGTAMAISGAAASPNMGYHSSPLAAIVMTLFNARMGWWLANPGEAGRRFWDKDGPAFGIKPFLDEALGNTDDQNRYVYLSDGGHFENLAIFEMVLRRCKFIVAIDAGADDDYTKEDLGAAVRKIRIDLGIPIEFPWGMDIDRALGAEGKRCALGKIRYDLIDEGAEAGEILYIKPVMIGNEPADVKNYGSASPKFPQEPTSDQWFNEAQFESYRSLGAFSIEEIVDEDGPLTVPDLFRRAARYLSNRSAHDHVRSAAAGMPL